MGCENISNILVVVAAAKRNWPAKAWRVFFFFFLRYRTKQIKREFPAFKVVSGQRPGIQRSVGWGLNHQPNAATTATTPPHSPHHQGRTHTPPTTTTSPPSHRGRGDHTTTRPNFVNPNQKTTTPANYSSRLLPSCNAAEAISS